VPQTGHASAFKEISAPQQVQKAAMLAKPPIYLSPLDERRKIRIRVEACVASGLENAIIEAQIE